MTTSGVALHKAYAVTHVGCVRVRNEDSILLKQDMEKNCLLAVVADGMGGHQGGATASATAVELFDAGWDLLQSGTRLVDSLLDGHWLTRIAQLAHEAIRIKALQDTELASMGTTLVVAALCGNRASIAHIGDSRAYRFNGADLLQVPLDHSLVQRMVDDGAMTESEAERSPLRNYLTRSLGGGDQSGKPDICALEMQAGERLLLCSDGLTNMLGHDEIGAILAGNEDDEMACQCLLKLALDRGASDNVSIIVVTV